MEKSQIDNVYSRIRDTIKFLKEAGIAKDQPEISLKMGYKRGGTVSDVLRSGKENTKFVKLFAVTFNLNERWLVTGEGLPSYSPRLNNIFSLNDVLNTVKETLGLKEDAEIEKSMGVKPGTIAGLKKVDQYDEEKLKDFASRLNQAYLVNPDYVLGKSETRFIPFVIGAQPSPHDTDLLSQIARSKGNAAAQQEDQRDNAEKPDLAAYDKGGRHVFTADTKSGKTDIVAQLLQELREDRRELREDRRLILENQRLVSETATAAQRAAAAAEKSAGSVAELVATVDSLKETVVGEIARREVLQDKLLRQISVPGQSSPEELEAELHIAWTERMRLYRSDTHSGKGTLHTH